MMNTFRVLFFLLVLLGIQLLMGQEVLQPIVTWDAGIYTELKCENRNQGGSDINNDGFDDYLTITSGDSFVQFYLGGEELQSTFNFELLGVNSSYLLTWGGDLNGDGYNDLVWSITDHMSSQSEIYINMGEATIDLEPEMIITPEDIEPGSLNIEVLNSGYDFNGDGYDDLLVRGKIDNCHNGMLFIFLGADEFDTEPDYYIQGITGDSFGRYFSAGDMNGDGFDDLIASRGISLYDAYCQLEVYLGGEELDIVCDQIIPDTLYFGYNEHPTIADLNGDDREELIIESQEGNLKTYYIDSAGQLVVEDYDIVLSGNRVTADINGDSQADLVCWNQEVEKVAVYFGRESISYEYDAYIDVAHISGLATEWFFCSLGDINGDGKDELLINNGDGTGDLGTTATIYGLPGNDNDECKIEKVKCKINTVVWDGCDDSGQSVGSGVYLCRLTTGGNVLASKKMLLLK